MKFKNNFPHIVCTWLHFKLKFCKKHNFKPHFFRYLFRAQERGRRRWDKRRTNLLTVRNTPLFSRKRHIIRAKIILAEERACQIWVCTHQLLTCCWVTIKTTQVKLYIFQKISLKIKLKRTISEHCQVRFDLVLGKFPPKINGSKKELLRTLNCDRIGKVRKPNLSKFNVVEENCR